jgi:signal transduction histidine kinase
MIDGTGHASLMIDGTGHASLMIDGTGHASLMIDGTGRASPMIDALGQVTVTDDVAVPVDALAGHPLTARLSRGAGMVRGFDSRRPWVLDTAVVVGIFVVFCLPDLIHLRLPPQVAARLNHVPVGVLLLLQVGLLVPVWWRRRAPAAAFYAVAAVFILQWSLGVLLRADVALVIVLYSMVLHGDLPGLLWAALTVTAGVTLVAWRIAGVVGFGDGLFSVASGVTAAAALGFAVRIRRAQLAALRERAVRLEVERDQRSLLAAAAERTRVAREMHDVVGHNLSVIITLADGGAYAAGLTPERSRQALELIGDTGRQALAELRRMLGVLREEGERPDLSPQPTIADIPPLCERVRAAGPQVTYQSTGDLAALDLGVQLAAYRIVQEALTNTLKHAGPHTRAVLTLTVDGPCLRIAVRDSGPQFQAAVLAQPAQHRHGLTGMAERAALYGGTVVAGGAPGGGWTLEATLRLELEDPS